MINRVCKIKNDNFLFLFSGFLSAHSNEQGKSQQYFLESPRNQTVNEGDSILLKCQVGNLQGIVQWTRAGFAMGKYIEGGQKDALLKRANV